LTKKTYKPVLVNSSIGQVLRYDFETEGELHDFFLKSLAVFQKHDSKTKVIGKSIYVFKKINQEDNNVGDDTVRTEKN
jgi:hypothetical protein|tara:strand:- start:723 stop:956 length:234 start_codon:yes stop_codon:yes gene_type:complete